MRKLSRAIASASLLAFTLTACGGHSSVPAIGTDSTAAIQTQTQTQAAAQNTSATRSTDSMTMISSPNAPMVAIPNMAGALAFTDAGRRASTAPVAVSVTLRYNHQAELDQFVQNVNDPHSAMYHQYLTPAQFNQYYAPTAQQEQSVVSALQAAGFTITQRFPNRTIVDATAPSATVEKFFATEMHTVRQGKYGERFANMKSAVIPSSISSIIRDASLNNLVVVQTVAEQAGVPSARSLFKAATDATGKAQVPLAASGITTADSSGNLVNGGFETGALTPWIDESSNTPSHVKVTTAQAHSGSYSAFMGTTSTPEVRGYSSIAQLVTVPANGKLSFWVYRGTNETSTTYAFQAGYLLNSSGSILTTFYKTANNGRGWVNYTVDLSAYAGQTDYLYFGVYGDGYSGTYIYQYVDDVTWSGTATPTPAPTASPTPVATASPTSAPTASPTPKPSTSPTVAPTSTPTTTPTSTPAPTPTPTAAPTSSGSCNNAPIDNGPLTNSSGTLGTGVAKPFDFPVQHGCNGAGETAAIVIDDPVNTSYLKSYLTAAQITETGTVTNEAVDGGGSGDDAETDLDVQTIAGLAPGANIIVYHIGSLTDQAIEDGYNKVLSDGKAQAVNSSFGGCESSDTAFADATNSIAQQGAAEGVEFSASSGDTGSNECSGSQGVSAPAGGPYFLSVGGVNFTDTAQGVLQTVTEGSASGDSGGGGVSTVFALPSYQSGITGMITSGRNQPDISLPFFPVAVYTGGAFGEYLGTSWSSPASVALILESDELLGTKLGWVNPTIYSLFKSTGYSTYFTPCTSGTNGAYTCNGSQYNQAAGIGAPKGYALAGAL